MDLKLDSNRHLISWHWKFKMACDGLWFLTKSRYTQNWPVQNGFAKLVFWPKRVPWGRFWDFNQGLDIWRDHAWSLEGLRGAFLEAHLSQIPSLELKGKKWSLLFSAESPKNWSFYPNSYMKRSGLNPLHWSSSLIIGKITTVWHPATWKMMTIFVNNVSRFMIHKASCTDVKC